MSNIVYAGFPLDQNGQTHIYVEDENRFVAYCKQEVARHGKVCNITSEELRELQDSDEYDFCPQCIQRTTERVSSPSPI